jgi:hypothetical protein
MKNIISQCAFTCEGTNYCQLTPTSKGWGCRFLATPIEELPTTDKEKAKLFSKVYREAKEKGVLECPHYRSLFIDEVLENIEKSNVIQQNMN